MTWPLTFYVKSLPPGVGGEAKGPVIRIHYADDRRELFALFISRDYGLSITAEKALAMMRIITTTPISAK